MNRRRVLLSLLALGAFGILIALGIWQWERRVWKNDLIARFEAALSRLPIAYEPPRENGSEGHEFRRVRVSGQFENSQTVRILTATPEAARTKTREGFGYLIFTPLKFSEGIVFVIRGFVPQNLADDKSLFAEGETEVTGIVRLSGKPDWFSPKPDPAKRLFFVPDIPSMAAAANVAGDRVILSAYI
ncbi:MAG: SURF1 family protein, partial [Rhodomicrobium sp.]|nr:SURF1 family protein [Rhodomicrobium sp.]